MTSKQILLSLGILPLQGGKVRLLTFKQPFRSGSSYSIWPVCLVSCYQMNTEPFYEDTWTLTVVIIFTGDLEQKYVKGKIFLNVRDWQMECLLINPVFKCIDMSIWNTVCWVTYVFEWDLILTCMHRCGLSFQICLYNMYCTIILTYLLTRWTCVDLFTPIYCIYILMFYLVL